MLDHHWPAAKHISPSTHLLSAARRKERAKIRRIFVSRISAPFQIALEFCAGGLDKSWSYFPTIAKLDRKSTRLNSSHTVISYAVFCLKKKNINYNQVNCIALSLGLPPMSGKKF